MRIFDNTFNVPNRILLNRFASLDDQITIENYSAQKLDAQGEVIGTVNYLRIDSTMTDAQVQATVSATLTPAEQTYLNDFISDKASLRAEYQSTLDSLQQIQDTVSPTNAQVVAGVKFIAKTIKLMLRILAKIYIG